MISGAAGSTGSIEHAIRGLSEFLMVVLNDQANLNGLEMSLDAVAGLIAKSESTQSVLQALRGLPLHQSESLAESSIEPMDADASHPVMVERSSYNSNDGRTLYVHRTKEWIDKTSENVDKLLSATFPHVCHPNILVFITTLLRDFDE